MATAFWGFFAIFYDIDGFFKENKDVMDNFQVILQWGC